MWNDRDHRDDAGVASRRDWLLKSGAGFGAVALSGLLQGLRPARAAEAAAARALAPRITTAGAAEASRLLAGMGAHGILSPASVRRTRAFMVRHFF